jgi:membrane-associated phospholipid phosphatase
MALLTRTPHPGLLSVPRLSVPRPSRRVTLATLGAVFVALTVDALLNVRAAFDLRLLRAIQAIDLPFLHELLRPMDWLTSGPGAVTMWALLLASLLLARWWVPALALVTLPAGGVINEGIGALTNHVRPSGDEVDRFVTTSAASFPSGHVAGAVLLYGFLFVLADRFENRAVRTVIKVASLGVVGITGFARLWYGAHWPSDVFAAYALGGLLLLPLVAVYRKLDASVGRLPLIKAAVPAHDEAIPHAHALTSLVLFDAETVSKVYAPGLLPRAIYWLAFQAEFPYLRNTAALEAAKHRRNLAVLLTEYWYGTPRVARVTEIERFAGGYALTSERVDGREPADKAAAKAWLRDLRARFEDAGLPTWQIDPRQPRAVDNVLETVDGRHMIVDLESGLVAPIASRKTWARAIRRGLVPMYDDVFFDITRAYVAREEAGLRAALGEAKMAELIGTLDAAEATALAWHRSEPRIWSKIVRAVMNGFGVKGWPAALKAKLAGSQEKAQEWLGRAIDSWEDEGRVTAAEATEMRAHMNGAEFQAMLPHLGAHIIISIPLRFPFGSIARAAWSAGALAVATGRLLARRISRKQWQQAWSIHSPLVILLSAVPGFGTFAYLAAKPVRSNRLLLRATGDAAMKKVPFKLYRRTKLDRIVARPLGAVAAPAPAPPAVPMTVIGPVIRPAPQPGSLTALALATVREPGRAARPFRVIPGSRGAGGNIPLPRTGGGSIPDPAHLPAA